MIRALCFAIPLIVTGFVSAFIYNEFFGPGSGGSKHMLVKSDLQSISRALRIYKINAGQFPSTEQGLQALVERPTVPPLPEDWQQVMTKTPTDPWRREFQYRLIAGQPDARFELRSLGPDGIYGTADDRVSE